MIVRQIAFLVAWCTILNFKIIVAGPMKRSSRMVREVYPAIEPTAAENGGNQAQVCIVGDVVYGIDEAVPADQPCLKCKCQPPVVQCETIQCVKKPGCKAIHKPNKCCPDYQCECEHNGKLYGNGEKLETPPGGECKVCYCRGGELQCAEVSCYIRKDCGGKRVPGTCCPKYDHCPPIDSMLIKPSQATQSSQEAWSIIPLNYTETISDFTSDDLQNENIIETSYFEGTTTTFPYEKADEKTKITIQEIIPERQEIPVTAPPKLEQKHHGTLLIEEAHGSNDLVTDPDTDFSEISETYQHPPPVLKIGDKFLFLKKGEFVHENDTSTPGSVITIIGAEGLQRGFEESAEAHDVKSTSESTDNITAIEELTTELNTLSKVTSTHILSLVKKKIQPKTTIAPQTVVTTKEAVKDIVSSTEEAVKPTMFTTIKEISVGPTSSHTKHYEPITDQNPAYPPLSEILSPNMDEITSQRFDVEANETSVMKATATPSSKAPLVAFTATTTVPEHTVVNESASKLYREIIEDSTTTAVAQHSVENTTTVTKILHEVLDMRSNSSVPENTTNSEWLKINTDTLINFRAALPDEILNPLDNSTEEESTTMQFGDEKTSTVESSEDFRFETTEAVITSSRPSKTVESLENYKTDSGERLTSKDSHASFLSNENASIEVKKDEEADDMVGMKERSNDVSLEKNPSKEIKFIDSIDETSKNKSTREAKDVEIIDTTTLYKPKPVEKLTDFPVKIIKRESSKDDSEDVFKDLDKELNDDQTDRSVSSDEERKESDAIFKELLEESSTSNVSQRRGTDILSRVTNAIAQFTLKGGNSNTNILELLSNSFGSKNNQ